jgi:hypothetical protein
MIRHPHQPTRRAKQARGLTNLPSRGGSRRGGDEGLAGLSTDQEHGAAVLPHTFVRLQANSGETHGHSDVRVAGCALFV